MVSLITQPSLYEHRQSQGYDSSRPEKSSRLLHSSVRRPQPDFFGEPFTSHLITTARQRTLILFIPVARPPINRILQCADLASVIFRQSALRENQRERAQQEEAGEIYEDSEERWNNAVLQQEPCADKSPMPSCVYSDSYAAQTSQVLDANAIVSLFKEVHPRSHLQLLNTVQNQHI
ncbi:uncharacterized protein V6R79_005273 [Siganus canaliculatus]